MGGAHFPGDNDAVEVHAACDGELDPRDLGKMEHGCEHYRRRCKIVAPCCKEVFPCRHCHNEATALGDRHTICRQDIEKVVCLLCDTEQQVSQVCVSCGVNMGEYFCDICKFYDDDTSKGQYHCNDCGICRVGGKENFFHCVKCGSCYSVALQDNHQCVENSMRQNCPICYEYLFDSLQGTRVLNCGHTMHMECFSDMVEHNKYTCPICSKTALDMSRHWQMLDQEYMARPFANGRRAGPRLPPVVSAAVQSAHGPGSLFFDMHGPGFLFLTCTAQVSFFLTCTAQVPLTTVHRFHSRTRCRGQSMRRPSAAAGHRHHPLRARGRPSSPCGTWTKSRKMH